MSFSETDPHASAPVEMAGVDLDRAKTAVILIHGRGSAAEQILSLARALPGESICYLAPQATGGTWYPQRFIAPLAANEPFLSSALGVLGQLVDRVVGFGIPRTRVLVGGFSQGACLSLEFAARTGGKFGGVFALSGALIGPPGATRTNDRTLDGTPVLIGCGDVDSHIPIASVKESSRVLAALGAKVTERVYPGVGHIVVTDEIERTSDLITRARDNG